MSEGTTTNYQLPYPTGSGAVSADPLDLQELCERLEAVLLTRSQAVFKPGDVKPTARATGSGVAGGWVPCDGRALSRTAYPALFSAIGTLFGGSGESFNVPDFRGMIPFGAYQNFSLAFAGGSVISVPGMQLPTDNASRTSIPSRPYRDSFNLGARGGTPRVVLRSAQTGVPGHSHPTDPEGRGVPVHEGSKPFAGTNAAIGAGTAAGTLNCGEQDAAESHDNMPPWLAVYYVIKT